MSAQSHRKLNMQRSGEDLRQPELVEQIARTLRIKIAAQRRLRRYIDNSLSSEVAPTEALQMLSCRARDSHSRMFLRARMRFVFAGNDISGLKRGVGEQCLRIISSDIRSPFFPYNLFCLCYVILFTSIIPIIYIPQEFSGLIELYTST